MLDARCSMNAAPPLNPPAYGGTGSPHADLVHFSGHSRGEGKIVLRGPSATDGSHLRCEHSGMSIV